MSRLRNNKTKLISDDQLNLVKEMAITNFRGFRESLMPIGRHLTIVFGKNGCLKSTLLGMIAQPFYFSAGKKTVYTTDYQNNNSNKYLFERQINGEKFETKYSDIFRMSETDISSHEISKYEYFLRIVGKNVQFEEKLSGKEGMLRVSSQYSKERVTSKRFRLVGGSSSHKQGTGNFPHPVIFLGLNRLFPMALSSLNEKKKIELSDEEREWFENSYSSILSTEVQDESVTSSFPINAKKRAYLLPSCCDCNYKSVSAGQDNVGQIVSAILSFKRLKNKLGADYRGGLLLIDELEATLHPISQNKLLEFLVNQSIELGIQIIATSHSSLVLAAAFRSEFAQRITPIHVKKDPFSVECAIDLPNSDTGYSKIKNDLFEEFDDPLPKLSVIVEDRVACFFLKAILGNKIMRNIVFPQNSKVFDSASSDFLIKLASYDFLNKINPTLYVLDADQNLKVAAKDLKNLLCLFGTDAPEKELYNYFKKREAWEKSPFKFNAATCFSRFNQSDFKSNPNKYGSEINFYKKWFEKMAQPSGFGLNCTKAISLYCKFHAKEVLDFKLSFCEAALRILPGNRNSKYAHLVEFFKNEYSQLKGSAKGEVGSIEKVVTGDGCSQALKKGCSSREISKSNRRNLRTAAKSEREQQMELGI